jgi:hypothetical protein
MAAGVFDDRWLDLFADVCARLTIRFADRGAVLWRAGFDDASWARLEGMCLAALEDPGPDGERRRVRFASAFAEARRVLAEPLEAAERSEAAPTVPRASFTESVAAPTVVAEPAPTVAEPPAPTRPLDVLQAMTTLASSTEASPTPPLKRRD